MPKKQTTAGKRARTAARAGEKFTAARRSAESPEEPPRIFPTVFEPCPAGCDGSAHPGALCRRWMPEDAKRVGSEVRRSAQLPAGRASVFAERFESGSFHGRDADELLALVYAMLTDQHPELQPAPAELRAAVEADDLEAVNAALEPLDRAAARLLTKEADQWWGEVKPRLDAYASPSARDWCLGATRRSGR
ncbi:hypothetical protein [Streptomyces sp. NPDC055140]